MGVLHKLCTLIIMLLSGACTTEVMYLDNYVTVRWVCCRIIIFIYLFIIPEIHQSGYGTCYYIIIGRVQKSLNT